MNQIAESCYEFSVHIGIFVPKVFSFLLVPVYTAYLTTEEYEISDFVITTASLLFPIFSLSKKRMCKIGVVQKWIQ